MGIIDDILSKTGLKYEQLKSAERDTLNQWIQALDSNQLTVERVKGYISTLKDTVENELASEPEYIQVFIFKFRNDRNVFLKARLRNLLLIDALLTSPAKAKEALNRAIAGMVGDRGLNKPLGQ